MPILEMIAAMTDMWSNCPDAKFQPGDRVIMVRKPGMTYTIEKRVMMNKEQVILAANETDKGIYEYALVGCEYLVWEDELRRI